MPLSHMLDTAERLRPVLGSIRTTTVGVHPSAPDVPDRPAPFVTVSRQAGIDAGAMAHRLVDRLNELDAEARGHPWTCWDRELVEKVAADQHLSRPLVESVEDGHHSWFSEFLEGLRTQTESEEKAYYRVAATIRALAKAGRVVIVGRGGVHVTRGMPAGVHFRFVAPFDWRVASVARARTLSPDQAGIVVRETERNREAFLKVHWPGWPMTPESFTATFNLAGVDDLKVVEAMALLTLPLGAPVKASPGRTG